MHYASDAPGECCVRARTVLRWRVAPFLIALGGAFGTLLRYWTNVASTSALGSALPYGTFAVNVIGSFLIGALGELGEGRALLGVPLRLVLGTGVLGGFTTYSSFNAETLRIAQSGELGRASLYALATLASCWLAGLGGIVLGRMAR
jgi:CrcB protein